MDRRFYSRPKMAALVVAAFALAALAGCGSDDDEGATPTSDSAEGELTSVAYANVSDGAPLFKSVGDGIVSLARSEGIEITRYDNAFDPGKALQNARLMVADEPDVLIDWSAVADANIAIGRQFERAEKPCIAVNVPIPSCAFTNILNPAWSTDAGNIAAEQAKNRGWTDADTTVLLVWAPAGGPEINAIATSFYTAYAKNFPDMTQATADDLTPSTTEIGDSAVLVDGQLALEPTYEAVNQVLPTIPKDRNLMVVTLNDDSARGAVRALEQAGRTENTMLSSDGADKDAIEQLRNNPMWIVEGSPFFEVWPEYLIAMARAVHAGAETPELTEIPQLAISKDTVDDFYDEDGVLIKKPPIPNSAAYLTEYGLAEE